MRICWEGFVGQALIFGEVLFSERKSGLFVALRKRSWGS
jgi:hypothetical protein